MLIKALLVSLLLSGFTNGFMDKCRYYELDCDTHTKCIHFERLCDGITDCGDKTDEANCVFENSTVKQKSRNRDKLEAAEFDEMNVKDEIEISDSFAYGKFIIGTILVLLVLILVAMLGYLYKKTNFLKPKNTSFSNPIYCKTTENINKELEEISL